MESGKKNIVFLYSELAGYVVSAYNELANQGHQVTVVRWQINKEAPFQFKFHKNIVVRVKDDFDKKSLLKFVESCNPDLLFVSGWMDGEYVHVAKNLKYKIPVVTGIDNFWLGTSKQKIGSIVSKFIIQNKFTHAFVAGEPQREFALKMGFKSENIITGLYTADTQLFDDYFNETFEEKSKEMPKVFLYVGRYMEVKGSDNLFLAFEEFKKEDKEWKLWCVGTGEDFDSRLIHEDVKHYGFVQPTEMSEIIKGASVFVLPSRKDNWGVVLQEYAAAGFPILTSKRVGASSAYLQDNVNGILLEDSSPENLLKGMRWFASKSQSELIEMGLVSRKLSARNSAKIWCQSLLSILNGA